LPGVFGGFDCGSHRTVGNPFDTAASGSVTTDPESALHFGGLTRGDPSGDF
jgi:hypothetical protein